MIAESEALALGANRLLTVVNCSETTPLMKSKARGGWPSGENDGAIVSATSVENIRRRVRPSCGLRKLTGARLPSRLVSWAPSTSWSR